MWSPSHELRGIACSEILAADVLAASSGAAALRRPDPASAPPVTSLA